MTKIVGLGGSRRPGSRALAVLRHVLAVAERDGAQTTLVDLATLDLPLFRPGAEPADSPALGRLAETVADCDAIVVASPVYSSTMSAAVKNVFEHLHDLSGNGGPLRGRAAGVVAVASGGQTATTLAALHTVCEGLGARVARTRVGLAAEVFDSAGTVCDPLAVDRLDALVVELTDLVRALRAEHPVPAR